MTDRELMQQAIEALTLCYEGKAELETVPDAIAALRQALDRQSECVTTIDIHPDLVAALNEQQKSTALRQALEQAAAWVGLTDEEIKALANWWPSYDQMPALKVLIKDMINSLKEKNT